MLRSYHTIISFRLDDVHAVVLPPLSTLRVALVGARPLDRWRIKLYPGKRITLAGEPDAVEWAASYAYPTRTASGEATVWAQGIARTLDVAEVFSLAVPSGQGYGLEIEGLGFTVDAAERFITAPEDVTIRVVERQPRLDVVVVTASGEPETQAGRVFCRDAGGELYLEQDIVDGRAVLSGDFEPGTDYDVRGLLANGERFHSAIRLAPNELERKLRWVGGEGAPSERWALPAEISPARLAAIVVENARGVATRGVPWTQQFFTRGEPAISFAVVGHQAIATGVPEDWQRAWLCADDGQIARVDRGAGAVMAPVARLEPVDLNARRAAYPGVLYSNFIYSLNWVDTTGVPIRVPLRRLRYDPATGDLPIWDLVAPRGFEAELRMRISREWVSLPLERAR